MLIFSHEKSAESHHWLPQAVFVVSYYCAPSFTTTAEPIPAPVVARCDLSGLLFV